MLKDTPDQIRAKNFTRRLTKKAIQDGLIARKSDCEKCGGGPTEIHHTNYDSPFAVMWLCRTCHRIAHGGTFCPPVWPVDRSGAQRKAIHACAKGHPRTPEHARERSDRPGHLFCYTCKEIARKRREQRQ